MNQDCELALSVWSIRSDKKYFTKNKLLSLARVFVCSFSCLTVPSSSPLIILEFRCVTVVQSQLTLFWKYKGSSIVAPFFSASARCTSSDNARSTS